jgi:hypothetical protein
VVAGLLFDHVSGDNGAYIVAPIYIVFGLLFFVFKRRIRALHENLSEATAEE